MNDGLAIENVRGMLTSLRDEALEFYAAIRKSEKENEPFDPTEAVELEEGEEFGDVDEDAVEIHFPNATDVGDRLTRASREVADDLARRTKKTMVQLASLVKGAALLGEGDLRDVGILAKKMSAALRFRRYRHWGLQVHHDEDVVLGVDPAGQSEDEKISVWEAHRIYVESYRQTMEMTDLVSSVERSLSVLPDQASSYKPDTAFIIMQIDKAQPGLEDVLDTVREVFKRFGIKARRADEIEHDDVITNRILEEISSSEFLFADLTGERPSVYYEVGYAHAIKKRVILYRKKEARIHFDLAHRNCPEYGNLKELRHLLHIRLADMTGKQVPEE
jgi:hypothetical protein